MKKLFVGSVALVALLARPALAADLPVYKTPSPPPPAFSWTGIYIGVHAGAALSVYDHEDRVNSGDLVETTSQTITTGFLGGGQVGINYQTGPLIWGAEAQFSYSDLSGSSLCLFGQGFNCNMKTEWLGTLAGRVGFAFDRTMVFVKGGAAWAHNKYRATFILANDPEVHPLDASENRWGWMFGTGVEHAFFGNWSAKVEYDYLDFGTKSQDFGINPFLDPGVSLQHDIRQRIHLVKFGLNYRFGNYAPVVAKY